MPLTLNIDHRPKLKGTVDMILYHAYHTLHACMLAKYMYVLTLLQLYI